MLISPEGKLRLCSVPLDNSYTHQIYFGDISSQSNYFASRAIHNFDREDYTYMQKDGLIRVNKNADKLYHCNYVMYQNSAFSNKWFYGFITEIQWLSDSSASIRFETDVWQTWHFDYRFRPSFVIREHVSDDSIGLHTLDEGVELGEFITHTQANAGLTDLRIVLATTVTNPETGGSIGEGIYGGTYSGSAQIVFPFTSSGANELSQFLKQLTDKGKAEAVTAIYVCPTMLLGGHESGTMIPNINLRAEKIQVKKLSAPSTVDGYTPKNKKLLCDPYMFCYVHNNAGSGGVYPYEYFNNREATFELMGTPVPNPIVRLIPTNYKGLSKHYDEGLSIGGFPLLSWNYDTYRGWLAQSGASTAISTVGSIVALGAGIFTGGAVPIIGGALGALASLNRWNEAKKQPSQAKGNALSGSVNVADRINDFFVCHKSIKAEYARIIDEYFNMYGYKVNRVKNINFNTRPYWNYVQVNDLSVTGAVPSPDMDKLRKIFQAGITFWKNGNNVGDYSLNNSI